MTRFARLLNACLAAASAAMLSSCGSGADPAPPAPQVTMKVSNGAGVSGSFVITLAPNLTPVTVANFLAYVNAGFYDGVAFHRYSPNFVLQGGGYNSGLDPNRPEPQTKAAQPPIVLEDNAGLSNTRLTVAMARTTDPDSANSQFFINLNNNLFLDRTVTARGYAVFGAVTAGADFVTAMTAAPCLPYPALVGPNECTPVPNLVITSARQTQ
jgi:cyclophilin family peptidyl-prolyl cis-trans isomerase